MLSAANRVYSNLVIVKNVVCHLDKPSLVSLMATEGEGDVFDQCVQELYREVKFHAFSYKVQCPERFKKYLDAVEVIHAEPVFSLHKVTSTGWLDESRTQEATELLTYVHVVDSFREACPNLRLITRQRPVWLHPAISITMSPGQDGGLVSSQVPIFFPQQGGELPEHFEPPPFFHGEDPEDLVGWTSEVTGALMTVGVDRNPDNTLRRLRDTDSLHPDITAIELGAFSVPLVLLGDIARSRRGPDKKVITRYTVSVEPFSIDDLEAFIAVAGAGLTELDLCTGATANIMTTRDLAKLTTLVRSKCSVLQRLALSITTAGTLGPITDGDIPPPPADVPFVGGTLERLTFKLYKARPNERTRDHPDRKAEKLLSLNFARNCACLTKPKAMVRVLDGEQVHRLSAYPHVPGYTLLLAILPWQSWIERINGAIAFFHRLGPILEPHFRSAVLSSISVSSITDLPYLQYRVDGTPYLNEERARFHERQARRKRLIDKVAALRANVEGAAWTNEDEEDYEIWDRERELNRVSDPEDDDTLAEQASEQSSVSVLPADSGPEAPSPAILKRFEAWLT